MDIQRLLNSTPASDEVTSCSYRAGKWSPAEERYAAVLITHFLDGALEIPSGTSLRRFLAHKLQCSPMRVTTKLTTTSLDGQSIPRRLGPKRYFPRRDLTQAYLKAVASEIHRAKVWFLRSENLVDRVDHTIASTSHEHKPQRVGSWSHEEQVYAIALIGAFRTGLVNLKEGVTLRAYLAERLCCNPMRISKKLATGTMARTIIPKRLGSVMFLRHTRDPELIARTEYDLGQLREICFHHASRRAYAKRSRFHRTTTSIAMVRDT